MRRGGADDHLAGQHHLAPSPPRRSAVAAASTALRTRPAAGRCGSPGGRWDAGRATAGRVGTQSGQPRLQRGCSPSASSPGLTIALSVRNVALAAAAERELGQDHRARRERGPGRGGAALRVEGEAADPDRAGACRQPARLLDHGVPVRSQGTPRPPRQSDRPREMLPRGRPRAPPSAKLRSGCSQQNQRSEASRETNTAAQGSMPSTGTVTLTSVRRPRPAAAPIPSLNRASRPSVVTTGDRDLAGADHLDQTVWADHPLEGLDLVGRAGHLDRHRAA